MCQLVGGIREEPVDRFGAAELVLALLPDAIAMPMQSGIATRNTTMEAVRSRLKVPPERVFSMIYSAACA